MIFEALSGRDSAEAVTRSISLGLQSGRHGLSSVYQWLFDVTFPSAPFQSFIEP